MVVSPRYALFAAAATAAIPALVYAPDVLIEEPLAYPFATLVLLPVAKALLTRRRGWIAAAVVASLVAPLFAAQLAVLPLDRSCSRSLFRLLDGRAGAGVAGALDAVGLGRRRRPRRRRSDRLQAPVSAQLARAGGSRPATTGCG